jgi:hypothetical protein
VNKHTHGPWHVVNGNQIRGEKDQIAKVWMMRGGEGSANARLIAAAPDMVEVIDRVTRYLADLNGSDWIKGDDAGSVDMRQRAKALQTLAFTALAKATEKKETLK